MERLVREALRTSDGDEALAPRSTGPSSSSTASGPSSTRWCAVSAESAPAGSSPRSSGSRPACPSRSHLELAEVTVSPEVASALWFVCSESLANAVKHARRGAIRVALVEVEGIVRLSVEDDGRGGADTGGSGLVGLADRVAALGGRLDVRSPAGGGTRVVAELPLGRAPG